MRLPIRFYILITLLAFPLSASAALIDRGNGLIYDDELDMTWLQNANGGVGSIYDKAGAGSLPGFPPYPCCTSSVDGLMTWENATAWVESLEYEGYNDWRLPSVNRANQDPRRFINCSTGTKAECLENELGYMYFYNLGGERKPGGYGTDLTGDPTSIDGVQFFDVRTFHWTSTGGSESPWSFRFDTGGSGSDVNADWEMAAWAVRDGDSSPLTVDVPAPATGGLLTLGLAVLLASRRFRADAPADTGRRG